MWCVAGMGVCGGEGVWWCDGKGLGVCDGGWCVMGAYVMGRGV